MLYRKALTVTDKWAHWILLATIKILETNTTPPLCVASLCQLRDLCPTENSSLSDALPKLEDTGAIIKDIRAVEKTGKVKHSSMENSSPTSHQVPDATNNSKKRKFSESIEKSDKLIQSTADKVQVCSNSDFFTPEIAEKATQVTVSQSSFASQVTVSQSSFTSQVTPKMLLLTRTKYTQMRKKVCSKACQTEDDKVSSRTLSSQGSQTEEDLLYQVNSLENTDCKVASDKETQTLVVTQKDFSCQYKYVVNHRESDKDKNSSKIQWKLIPIPGLPIQKQPMKITKSVAEVEASKFNCVHELTTFLSSELGVESGDSNGPEKTEICDHKCTQKLFQGRPLITSKSKIVAPSIPLDPIDSFLLCDPRDSN